VICVMVCSKPTWSFPASFPKEGIPSFPRPNDEPWTKTRGIQEVHDISWYFMIFHEVHAERRPFHGHFHTPRIHALTVHRPWLRCLPFHTTCPPASLRETWDLPQNEGSGSRATLGCLAASVVSAASSFDRCCSSVGTVSTSCGPDLGYYNAMWPASSIPWSRCPTRIRGAPTTADNSG